MNTTKHRLFSFVLGSALLGGCAAGPDFIPPEAPTVTNYTATELSARTAAAPVALGESQSFVANVPVHTRWWEAFGSPKLDALIERALQSSPTLEAAEATLRQALHTHEARAGATRLPQANAGLGTQRQQVNNAASGLAGGERLFNLYNASVGVSYNLDLSGGNRRALEALAAQVDYQRFQLDGARLTLVANVITTTVTQVQLAGQIEASERILAAQEEQLEITRRRVVLGAASQTEVLALQTQVEQTRAGIAPLRSRLEQTNHLLAVLIGQPPGLAAMPQFTLVDFNLPTELPLSLPSELARKRPDIRAAEALLHAATARYGVAVSNFYPRITLSASAGSQALTTASLFGSGSLVWGLAGQLTQPLFNGGLRAEARAAEAEIDAVVANYRQTVLQALRNVADVLRVLDADAQTLASYAGADAAAQESLQLIEQQHALGAASYLQLLVAQQQAQQTRVSVIASRAQRLADTAALYQAMGGG